MKALKRVLVVMCSSAGQSSFSSFIFGFVHQTPHTHIYYLIHIHSPLFSPTAKACLRNEHSCEHTNTNGEEERYLWEGKKRMCVFETTTENNANYSKNLGRH